MLAFSDNGDSTPADVFDFPERSASSSAAGSYFDAQSSQSAALYCGSCCRDLESKAYSDRYRCRFAGAIASRLPYQAIDEKCPAGPMRSRGIDEAEQCKKLAWACRTICSATGGVAPWSRE